MKRTLALFLSLLMAFGLFSGLSVNAAEIGASDTGTEVDAVNIGAADVAAGCDLAEVGAYDDLSEVGADVDSDEVGLDYEEEMFQQHYKVECNTSNLSPLYAEAPYIQYRKRVELTVDCDATVPVNLLLCKYNNGARTSIDIHNLGYVLTLTGPAPDEFKGAALLFGSIKIHGSGEVVVDAEEFQNGFVVEEAEIAPNSLYVEGVDLTFKNKQSKTWSGLLNSEFQMELKNTTVTSAIPLTGKAISAHELKIDNSTVNFRTVGTKSRAICVEDIYWRSGHINDSTIRVNETGGSCETCLSTNGPFSIDNSSITLRDANSYGLLCPKLTIKDSTVTAIGEAAGISQCEKLTIDNSIIDCVGKTALAAEELNIVNDSRVYADASGSGTKYGVFTWGKVTVDSSKLRATGSPAIYNMQYKYGGNADFLMLNNAKITEPAVYTQRGDSVYESERKTERLVIDKTGKSSGNSSVGAAKDTEPTPSGFEEYEGTGKDSVPIGGTSYGSEGNGRLEGEPVSDGTISLKFVGGDYRFNYVDENGKYDRAANNRAASSGNPVTDDPKLKIRLTEYIGTDEVVYVPERYAGLDVYDYSGIYFIKDSQAERLYFPDGVFYGNDPEMLSVLGTDYMICHLSYCSKIKSIKLPETLNASDRVGLGTKCFGCDYLLEEVIIPDNYSRFYRNVFYNCSSLKQLDIPSKLTKIDDDCFKNCESLITLDFSQTQLEKIGMQIFAGCTSLKKISFGKVDTTYRNPFFNINKDVVIEGYAGSDVQRLAEMNGYTFTNTAPVTVSFAAGGGLGEMVSVGLDRVESYELPEPRFTAPEGKLFKCWSVGGKEYAPGETITVNANTTVYAKWTNSVNTVTFKANGGSGTMEPLNIQNGRILDVPGCSFTHASKKFTCWMYNGKEYYPGDDLLVNDDLTLTAMWEDKASYYVYYDSNGSSSNMNWTTVYEGDLYTVPKCTMIAPNHKQFGFWTLTTNEDAKLYPGDKFYISEDTTLRAIWVDADKINVYFDANGGSGAMAEDSFYKGDIYVVPECTLTAPTGKEFVCWYCTLDDKSYNKGDYINLATRDFVLKAQWKDKAADYEYRDNADGTLTLYRYRGGDPWFYIPTTSNGKRVTILGGGTNYVLYDNDTILKIVVPTSIIKIGNRAVQHCDSLGEIDIPGSVLEIGSSAFANNPALSDVQLGSGVTKIGNWAFEDCPSLNSVKIPSSVTSIGDRAFGYYENQDWDGENGDQWLKVEGFTIIGSRGSAAENYAIENGFIFVDIEEMEYDLWVGSTRVSGINKDNILGDGTASFDPDTSTLTLNSANITGYHVEPNMGENCAIYCDKMNLTIKGSGTIGNGSGCGVDIESGSLILDGDFTIKGAQDLYGIIASQDIVFNSGNCTVTGAALSVQTLWVNKDVKKLEVTADDIALGSFTGSMIVYPALEISLPKNGKVLNGAVCDSSGNHAARVIISGENFAPTPGYETKTDPATGIEVIAPEDTVLVVEKVDNSEVSHIVSGNVVAAYRVYLKKNGVVVKPDKPLTVTIPCGVNNVKVYRIDADNSVTNMDADSNGLCALFTTDALGLFAVAVPKGEYIIGDVNNDGTVDILDAVIVQKYTADKLKLTDNQLYVADVNADNNVDILDAVTIQKYTVGKITEFKKKA